MRIRKRIFLYAALAAVVPLQAFALEGPAPPSGMTVRASLGICGVAESSIVCKIHANFTGFPGAQYYTASVVRPDGSVGEFGTVSRSNAGGSVGLWVPYVGRGTYTVRISAWGEGPEGEKEVVAKDESGGEDPDGAEGEPSETEAEDTVEVPPVEEPPASDEEPSTEEPSQCETADEEAEAPEESGEAGPRSSDIAGEIAEVLEVEAEPKAQTADPEECPEAPSASG